MCLSKPPKAPPSPVMPSVYNPGGSGVEVIDQASQDANNRTRRMRASWYGRASTVIAGGMGGNPTPATSGAKTLLGG